MNKSFIAVFDVILNQTFLRGKKKYSMNYLLGKIAFTKSSFDYIKASGVEYFVLKPKRNGCTIRSLSR